MPAITSGSSGGSAPGSEINYTAITVTANVTDTAEATATALISPGAITFDGAPVMVEFFCPAVVTDTAAVTDLVTVTLFEGATQITRLGIVRTVAVAAPDAIGVTFRFRFTPSAGSHTYKVCAFATSTTGTPALTAGTGGTGGYPATFVRFTKV